jgi:hypothetical protein
MRDLNKKEKHELAWGVVATMLIVLAITICMSSCESPRELHQRKIIKAKHRIDKIVSRYPELRSLSDTTYTHTDTVVYTNKHYINDSVFIKGGTRIDTVVQINDMDSIFTVLNDNIRLRLDKMTGGQVRASVSVITNYIYETDTLLTRDTIYRERITTENNTIINTKKSFWWSLWFQVKGWLWFVLIIVAILVILRLVFKFLK